MVAVNDAVEHWLECHDRVAPGLIEGLYIVGSIALDDWRPGSDIDIVAFTADPATDEDAELLLEAHHLVRDEIPNVDIDGPILAWGDVTVPPYTLHRPWTLGGVFHHDAECFEINPITWYVLDRHGVGVRGPDVDELQIVTDAEHRVLFVGDNVDLYWRPVGEAVTAALDDPTKVIDGGLVEWCVLGVARMLYTFRTADVASKPAAGRWLAEQLPQHREVIEQALEFRDGSAPGGPLDAVDRPTAAATAAVVNEVVALILG